MIAETDDGIAGRDGCLHIFLIFADRMPAAFGMSMIIKVLFHAVHLLKIFFLIGKAQPVHFIRICNDDEGIRIHLQHFMFQQRILLF